MGEFVPSHTLNPHGEEPRAARCLEIPHGKEPRAARRLEIPHGEEPRAARRLEPWPQRQERRLDNPGNRSKRPAINASFLARDQPLICRSAAIASTI